MVIRGSDLYAPYGTCPRCGWSGKDWGFKYHSFCRSCYKKWRKEKAEEKRKYKLLINNIKLSDNIVVTEHVYTRLYRRAKREVGYTLAYLLARIVPLTVSIVTIYLMRTIDSENGLALTIIMFVGFFLLLLFFNIFQCAWERQVKVKTNELAEIRKQDIEEQQRFYNSAEWRLIREQVIQERKHVCQKCGHQIKSDYDLTVDHIKPRSKFPELALDKSNLQIMCRRCNSAKGANYDESIITDDEPLSETVKNIELK